MSEQHTPGPWETSRDGVPAGYVQVTVYAEATGARVATVFEAEANARLIAAAPDLLAALRALYQWTTDHVDGDSDVLGALEDRARALLARVDGAEEASGPVPVVPVRTVQGAAVPVRCPECACYNGHTTICSQGRD